ncbi:MAG: hypothetical protein CMM91_08750 [Rickettsiales bacterium]|nr:hypothetical protein [Rickettsiales bacterium]OUV53130.1 MAG: hypothetical protein CBC87_04465 [Rickettsiales bacterium TMED127]
MKKLLFIFISLFCLKYNYALSQDTKIKWEDRDGREFSIKTISGDFEYSMVGGDTIYYYHEHDHPHQRGKVRSVGRQNIYYDDLGRVKSVGGVNIYYYHEHELPHQRGKVRSVGGLKIYYDSSGKVKSLSGKVN